MKHGVFEYTKQKLSLSKCWKGRSPNDGCPKKSVLMKKVIIHKKLVPNMAKQLMLCITLMSFVYFEAIDK